MKEIDLTANVNVRKMQLSVGTAEKLTEFRSVKGCPKISESDGKRERILDSALRLFTLQGVSDIKSADIAKLTGVTSVMIHYYFGRVEGLLQTLVLERLRPKILEV